MSLLPLVLRDMMSMMRPLRMLEQQMRVADEMFASPFIRYPKLSAVEFANDTENVVNDQKKFQLKLDVQHFLPNEITVKTVDNNTIMVEGKHEEQQDEKGFISRQFVRKFVLPQGHDIKDVFSELSSDGILTITAPKKNEPGGQERVVPISQTGPARDEKKKSE